MANENEAAATRLFRLTNFELFAKPTTFHRRLAAVGTVVFSAIIGGMLYEKHLGGGERRGI